MSGLLSDSEEIVNAKTWEIEGCTWKLELSDGEEIVTAQTWKFKDNILNMLNAQAWKLGIIDKSYIWKVVTASVWEYKGKLLKLLEIVKDWTCLLESGDDEIIKLDINELISLKAFWKGKINMEVPTLDDETIKPDSDKVVSIKPNKNNIAPDLDEKISM